MTEQRSALDSALDLLLYAPVGLALTAAEELPRLAAKGRAQVKGQVTIARMVGQFAVNQGRKEIEKRFVGPPRTASTRPTQEGTKPAGSSHNGSGRTTGDKGSYDRLSARTPAAPTPDEHPAHHDTNADEPQASVIDVDFGTTARSGPGAEGLAIPGYDSLSASQVVQRLAGLSQEELAAVGEYEAAHRGRRTILTRVGQLKG